MALGELRARRFAHKAEHLVALKESFEAETWERVLQVSRELAASPAPGEQRLAELSEELSVIAHANMAVDYSFGIARPQADAQETASGLIVESTITELSPSEAPRDMSEALEATSFFDAGAAKEDLSNNHGEVLEVGACAECDAMEQSACEGHAAPVKERARRKHGRAAGKGARHVRKEHGGAELRPAASAATV